MIRNILTSTFIIALMGTSLVAQNDYYFPPLTGDEWESKDPSELGWCAEKLDSLYAFLEEKNSRSFIILHEGKIVVEYYFGNADQSSFWYLASAGKSIAGFMTGMAQEQGLLDITDPVSTYLGQGWTDCPPDKEDLITVYHQISMSTGLDDDPTVPGVPDPANCLDPECLLYLENAGQRWAYHNAPYRLVQDVLANASGMSINQYTNANLNNNIDSSLFWLDYVCWGRARDAARFGLLALNRGVWDMDTLMHDQQYFEEMTTPSQGLNNAYGYLWWLNGQESFMLPGLQTVLPGYMFPDAPADMFSALGLNDQKIYVVPSLDMVVIRQGDAAGDPVAAGSSFDNQLWIKLNDLACETVGFKDIASYDLSLYPQPATDRLFIEWEGLSPNGVRILDTQGRVINELPLGGNAGKREILIEGNPPGLYMFQFITDRGIIVKKVVIQ
ncbi:MAG: serine hydrolase [Bacteroidetes bacterium]|nr:serine hydrolase [Bacteroidota bacterium]